MSNPSFAAFPAFAAGVALVGVSAIGLGWLSDQSRNRTARPETERLARLRAALENADGEIQGWLDRAALDGIAQLLHRREPTTDDIRLITGIVRGAGRTVDEPDSGATPPPASPNPSLN